MAFANVSETAQEERDAPRGPAQPPVFDFRPRVDLGHWEPFLKGQPFAAFAEMSEAAPVCWHPGDPEPSAVFWALTRKGQRARTTNSVRRLAALACGVSPSIRGKVSP